MQVEPCEIPPAGAPKILCRERFQTVPYDVRCNKPAPCLTRGRMRAIPRSAGQMGVFQQPASDISISPKKDILREIKILLLTGSDLLSHQFHLNRFFCLAQSFLVPLPSLAESER